MDLTTEAANNGAFLSVLASLLSRNTASTMLEEIPCGAAALADAATDLRCLSGNSGSTARTDVKHCRPKGLTEGHYYVQNGSFDTTGTPKRLGGGTHAAEWRPVTKGGVSG